MYNVNVFITKYRKGQAHMLLNFSAVFIFIIISIFFLLSLLFLNFLVSSKKKNKEKNEIFECGEPTVGNTKVNVNSHFFNVALVYILFDLEIAFLVPISLTYKELVNKQNFMFAFFALMFFILLLIVGLVYEWHVGNFDWIVDKSSSLNNNEDKRD